jgi:hypothetical protein
MNSPTLIGVSPNGALWQVTVEGEVVSQHTTRDEAVEAAQARAGHFDDGRVIYGDDQLDLSADAQPELQPEDHPGVS